MIRRPRLPLPLLLAVLGAGGCGEPGERSADEVLDRMLAAIDLEHVRPTIQSISATAEGFGPDGLFVTTVTSIPPGSLYFHEVSSRGTIEIWSTPESTWGGAAGEEYELLGPGVRDFIRSQEFHAMLLELRTRFSGFQLAGSDVVSGIDCLRIAMQDEGGRAASLCIDEERGLPVELRLDPGAGDGPLQVRYQEWGPVDGLMLFHSLHVVQDTDSNYSWNFVEISVNEYAAIRVPPPTLPRVRDAD